MTTERATKYAEGLKVSASGARAAIAALVTRGLAERVGRGRYKATAKGLQQFQGRT